MGCEQRLTAGLTREERLLVRHLLIHMRRNFEVPRAIQLASKVAKASPHYRFTLCSLDTSVDSLLFYYISEYPDI